MSQTSIKSAPSPTSSDFDSYQAYKEADVEYLSEIPSHWETPRLKYAVESSSRGNDLIKSDAHDEPGPELFPAFSASGQDVWVAEPTHSGPGIVVSAVGARCGKAFRADGRWGVVANTHVLQPRAGFDRDFLWYIVNDEDFWEKGGTAQPYVQVSASLNKRVPVPPTSEQEVIADFLDEHAATIDGLIDKKEHLIELLEEKRTALITRAVTKGLERRGPMKDSSVEWLGEIPKGWQELALKRVARPELDAFTDGDWVESPHITDSGIRLIQTGNIGVGQYREQGYRYIDKSSFRELDCTKVKPGDVLICRLADPVGRACMAPDLGTKMITSVDVCILRPRPKFDPRFIVYCLSSQPYLSWVASTARGGTRDRISRSMLGRVKVPVPPSDAQEAIADHLDQKLKHLRKAEDTIRRGIRSLDEYRSALITAAVTGKIDVRDHAA